MAKSNDPAWHQQCEREMAGHFRALLVEKKFVVDTTDGRKPVTMFEQTLSEMDQSVGVKRQMIELGSSDHALRRKLPVGLVMDVTLKAKHMVIFEKTFAHIRFQSVPPTLPLIRGEVVEPLTDRDVRAALASLPPPISQDAKKKVPITIVLCSSAGFTKEAQLLADRLSERTLILVEPNDAGGWNVHGTPETRAVLDLIDPEAAEGKRKRIRDAIASSEFELGRSGIAAEKLATQTQLPLSKVEEEFKKVSAEKRGLTAKRMGGHLVLYRETGKPANSGVGRMPILDKFRSIFASSNEKKIAFLAERRTQIAQQLDRVTEEVTGLEQHEQSLREQFKTNESALVRKRLTSQLVQLRKEIDRKAQLSTMLSQQANVVAAHLHTIELIQQGEGIKLPSGDELAEDAAKAEEVLAEVQADAELANELVGTTIRNGMSSEEAAMYDELMKDLAPQATSTPTTPTAVRSDQAPTDAQKTSPTRAEPTSAPQRRSEASPG